EDGNAGTAATPHSDPSGRTERTDGHEPALDDLEQDPPSELARSVPDAKPLPDIFMPNAFTPNGDGHNDAYTVDLAGFRSMKVRIISLQTNDVVFSINTEEEWAWDGRNCGPGPYLVAVEAITEDGRLVT